MAHTVGDRIVYPATAWFGRQYPDFLGTVLEVTPIGYLKVQFDAIKSGDVRTIAPADLA